MNQYLIGIAITLVFFSADLKGVYFIIVELVRFFIGNICIVQTIRYYSPLHLLGAYIYSFIFDWIIKMCLGDPFEPWKLVGYVIIAIGFMIFNEIIILHFCKLDYETKKMIEEWRMILLKWNWKLKIV